MGECSIDESSTTLPEILFRSGKSTLLKIMAGLDEFDAGSMQRNKGAKVGYLMQEPKMNESHTVLQAVLQSDSAVAKAVQSYQKAVASSSGDVISKDLEKAIECGCF